MDFVVRTGLDHGLGSTPDAIKLRRWNVRNVSSGRRRRYRHSKLVGLQGYLESLSGLRVQDRDLSL